MLNPQPIAPVVRPENSARPDGLVRGISLGSATALNMIDMIGVGPFITIPLIISAMGGPQAMLGWILGAFFAICDGLVWAELGATFPGSGGSYQYLKAIYGPTRWGRYLSFLFVWQLSFSAPLSIASGCIGLSRYASYLWHPLETSDFARTFRGPFGALNVSILITPATFLAIATCLFCVFLLYRRIQVIGKLSKLLWLGVLGTIGWVIFAGITHFNAARAFDFPAHAFTLNSGFFLGLGSAMLVAAYDYWGYYNVCFLGDEVEEPTRTIPRALIYSIVAVAGLYIVMNISILGVIPWRELDAAAKSDTRFYVVSVMMERLYGPWAGRAASLLIMWTALASVFSLLLGYSRVPYAAARDGNYFRAFARVHPEYHIPDVSLLALGAVASLFCFLRLIDVIAALVVIRIMIQFILQTTGIILLRWRHPELPRPFRMWLYPVPALLATIGFLYVLIERPEALKEVRYALAILVVGTVIYFIRAYRQHQWPFANRAAQGVL